MRTDRALLSATRGSLTASIDGQPVTLTRGQQRYVAAADTITVNPRSSAQLTFRGGSVSVLCATTQLTIGELTSGTGQPIQPSADLTLGQGRLLVDTRAASTAFHPLALSLTAGANLTNTGPARYATTTATTDVATGTVTRDGQTLPTDPTTTLTCGDGTGLPTPATSPSPSDSPSPSESPSPSDSPSASPTDSPSPSASRSTGPSRSASARTTTPGQPPPPPPPTTGPPPPPPNKPPRIVRASFSPDPIYVNTCPNLPQTGTLTIFADGVDEPLSTTFVYFRYTINGVNRGPILTAFHSELSPPDYQAALRNLSDPAPATIAFDIYALDNTGAESGHFALSATLGNCIIG
jgi:putative peptide zinc metalloprotease protein